MAKLKKKLSEKETEKSKVVNGKVTKVNKLTELPQMRKLQVKLQSPARSQQRNLENSTSATPFSTNSMIKFTSTPMNVENNSPNGRLSLKKITSRLPLSPIHSNICNTKQEDEITCQKRIEKGGNVEVPKNLPKSDMRVSKANNENKNPSIRIGTRRKSVGVQRIVPISENVESRCSRQLVRLRKLDSSIESIDSHSSKLSSKNTLQMHATNQKNVPAANPNSRTRHQKSAAGELPPNSGKNHSMVKRLRSDWSSTTLGEETLSPSVVQKQHMTSKSQELHDTSQLYKQNNCSKLRVRLRHSTLDCNSSPIDLNSKQRKSFHDNSLVKHLKSDWTNTTFEETPTQNRTPKDNQIQRKQVNKRRLTPLVEMSVENTTIPTCTFTATPTVATRTKNKSNEDEYSSSAEFQSDDEMNEQSRSKRAPTWKDLLNKTSETPVVEKNTLPVVRLKRSRNLTSKISPGPVLSLEKEGQKSQQKQKHNAFDDNCQVDSVMEVDKGSQVNKKNKGHTGEKEENSFVIEVSNDAPLKESHEIATKNKVSAKDVSVREEINASSSSQHNHLQKNDSCKSTSISPRCDETANKKIIDLTCPVKFFHSRLENTVSVAKPKESLKRRRSSKRKKQESIYEFLSQSSSESNIPVDDVIQKMIQTGKVVVAKHKKGTGKNTLPRKKTERARKKKITKTQEIPQKSTKPLTEKPAAREKIQEDFDDGLHFDDGFHFDDGENEIPDEEQTRDQRGFSNLARSAMIKQAGRIQKPIQRKPITDKKKLLAMALKFVNQSTPVRMSLNPTISAPQFSPMSGNKSPWRVDDDKLPNLFYLGRDSNNLPSFSSDYIPMTPTKNKSKSISSFSSNDSNGENNAPPGAKILTNEANMQALTNTRKALSYRSPLKAINILEVVNLPPLALHSYGKKSNDENTSNNNLKETAHSSTHKSTSNICESISNNNSNPNSNHSKSDVSNENVENQFENTQNQNVRKSTSDVSNENATNLFGFEELIDDGDSFTNVTIDKTILPNKDALKERLQRLKQLRPNKPVVLPNKTKGIQPVFDNVKPKQKTLKQMLCSTMIDNQHHNDAGNHSFNDTEDLSNLFKDLEPDTTFDDSLPRRTYNRPFKRKRKMLSNLAIIMDSDVSEDEEDEIKRPIKNYKAKPKKRQKNNPELNKFVNDFNEMCKEVSQYELIVE